MVAPPPGRLPFAAPMPKINLPPTREPEEAVPMAEPSNPWVVAPVAEERDAPERRGRAALWDFRFVCLLFFATIGANVGLALLLGTTNDAREVFLTERAPEYPMLSGLSPAAGAPTQGSGTTVYLPRSPDLTGWREPPVTPGAPSSVSPVPEAP